MKNSWIPVFVLAAAGLMSGCGSGAGPAAPINPAPGGMEDLSDDEVDGLAEEMMEMDQVSEAAPPQAQPKVQVAQSEDLSDDEVDQLAEEQAEQMGL